ncbi:MAG TPA: ATPase, T2SS/T4P/T4SS family [Gemmatimonadaceae bacterium]|nr:ATPase, T2SS/T4P/T4SS family [Gemmatimonadaceae bacterium]
MAVAERSGPAGWTRVGEVVEEGLIEMMTRNLGPVIMGAMEDDDVTEIYVNPQDREVRVDRRSTGRTNFPCTLDAARAEMFLNTAAARAGQTLGPGAPFLQTTLPGGIFRHSRLQGFVPPVTRGPAFAIRKPPAIIYALYDYVTRGTLEQTHCALLASAIERRESILVCGGTNSGKTTFANALIREISVTCPSDRIVILEDTAELQCFAPDHLALTTPVGGRLSQLVKATLRTSPDRIVVGEVRDEAALDLLDAWATGHPGGVATVHASTTHGALMRLDRLAQRANVPSQARLIAEAVDWVVMMVGGSATGAGVRRVSELAKVLGVGPDGTYDLHRFRVEDEVACVAS